MQEDVCRGSMFTPERNLQLQLVLHLCTFKYLWIWFNFCHVLNGAFYIVNVLVCYLLTRRL